MRAAALGEAESGASAVALVANLEPDLVLLDIQLSGIGGIEVASRLLERRPGLAIVLVSTRDHRDYGSLVELSGARGFVSKAELSGAPLEGLLN